ncbi:hypothetical protein HPB50_027757 [Hyalomma asiaticum]|nr:hypothetical protein HPB50_027757 [Hyalomma asiaticum]
MRTNLSPVVRIEEIPSALMNILSGIGSNASMANAYPTRLFLVQILKMAYLLACFASQRCAVGQSVVLPSLEMPRSVDSPATDQAIPLFPDSAPFKRRHDNATSVIEPPYQLFAHRPPARGTQLVLTSPTSVKKSCIDRARTSGLGSNASMANDYTTRLFLVQQATFRKILVPLPVLLLRKQPPIFCKHYKTSKQVKLRY